MTMAGSAAFGEDRSARWVLLASLALNLFFIGIGGALLARHYFSASAATPAMDRSIAARMDRLAATLPSADADILRAEYRANMARVDNSRDAYRAAQDAVRQTLRADPFEPDAMRSAMTATRAARQAFDQVLQDVIATASAKMSAAGRNGLADWPPGSREQGSRGPAPREANR